MHMLLPTDECLISYTFKLLMVKYVLVQTHLEGKHTERAKSPRSTKHTAFLLAYDIFCVKLIQIII